jgi:hypothetical protein
MVNRAETLWKAKNGILHRVEFGEVEVSQSDTVTFENFDSSKALMNVVFWKKTDGTAMTSTIALNVATVTGSGTNIDCVYMAYGYKA